MTRATSFALSAVVVFFLMQSWVQAQNPGQFGIVIYNGPTSADIYVGKLTNAAFSRVEFYRAAKKIGEVTLNGPSAGIITDNGLTAGNIYTYEYRAYPSNGAPPVMNVVGTAIGTVFGGEIKGYLTRRDEISGSVNLTDSLFIMPAGEILPDAVVPGGDLHIKANAQVGYDATFAGKILGINIYGPSDPSLAPGKFTAAGGTLKDVNIVSSGQIGPIDGMTFIASDMFVLSEYPTVITNSIFTWLTDNNRNDYAFIDDPYYNVTLTNCTLRNESTVQGVKSADHCTVEYDAILRGKSFTNCNFSNNGQVQMRPSFTPTIVRDCQFRSSASISLANQSTIQYNLFEASCILTVSAGAAGFPIDAVDSIHVNYNEFQRDGLDGTIISVVDCDTIDLTKNYWGTCSGPTNTQKLGRRAHFNPYLRALYPRTSYWLDIASSKKSVIADGQDSVEFTMHFFETISGRDTVGARVNYLVRVMGDTLSRGVLTTDQNGRASLVVHVPYKYKDAISMEAYFNSVQCIDEVFLIAVGLPSGADLQVLEAGIIQVNEKAPSIVAHKGFAVRTVINTTEPVTSPFKVRVTVNGNAYDTFYVYKKQNIGVQYQLENPLAQISLPSSESPTLYFPIREEGLGDGPFQVSVTIDPPDGSNPKGQILESDENNNVLTISGNAVSTKWGNDGSTNASVFVQSIDNMPSNQFAALKQWTDSTKSFIERAWPMQSGQLNFTIDQAQADYKWIHPDTLRQENWQYYLTKAYKIMRLANPMFDRYVFAVGRDWFSTRIHPFDFPNRHTQMISWSGIYDLMITSAQSQYFLAHNLGHSFGLRRGDLDPDSVEQQEQYTQEFIGTPVYDGMDAIVPRMIHTGTRNKVDRLEKAHCFMGNAKLTSPNYEYVRWISELEYTRLMDRFSNHAGSAPAPGAAVLVEGTVDSTTKAFTFGPWVRMNQAVYSSMMDSAYSDYTFKFLDASGTTLNHYYYHPTFVSLGMDEVGEMPRFQKEYFAFVAPFSPAVRRVIVEHEGATVAERVITDNPPVVDVTYPTDGSSIEASDSVWCTWQATDPDGGTDFWYTVYFSDDNGATWKLVTYEEMNQITALMSIKKGNNYKLRVVASDGINTSEKIITFNATSTAAEDVPTAGSFALHQNYPNPFNPSTTITYDVPASGVVAIRIVDLHGRVLRTLVNRMHAAGQHSITFDARDLPSGVYAYRLEAKGVSLTRMMQLMK